jgi:hypothetical protein
MDDWPRRCVQRTSVRGFYLGMGLVVAAIVGYGFSHTIADNLLHPAIARPWILYVHAAVFTSWLAFFVIQTSLVQLRSVRWHRTLGWAGLGLGAAVPVVGIWTAIAMLRFDADTLGDPNVASLLVIPFFDMICFTPTFIAAALMRKAPETHRRLMLIATCVLTAAAWGRMPWMPPYLFYAGVDALILLGVVRDLVVDHRVHRVYLYVLPPLAVGQVITTYLAFHDVPAWLRIAHAILGH